MIFTLKISKINAFILYYSYALKQDNVVPHPNSMVPPPPPKKALNDVLRQRIIDPGITSVYGTPCLSLTPQHNPTNSDTKNGKKHIVTSVGELYSSPRPLFLRELPYFVPTLS